MAASEIPRITHRTTSARIPTEHGEFTLVHFRDERDGKEHLAVVLGDIAHGDRTQGGALLVRVHSECFTGDVLGSLRCDCGEQLHRSLQLIAAEGRGVIVYLRQEGRGIGLEEKLRAYNLQDAGYDTVDANLILGHQADERDYSAAGDILADLGVESIRLLTNNPHKIESLRGLGVLVAERVPLEAPVTAENAEYLRAKAERMRHLLHLPEGRNGAANATTQQFGPDTESLIEGIRGAAQRYFRETGLPFVTAAYAQSINGAIGTREGGPVRISSPQAMRVTHALRAAHDAILVGVGTVLADNPRLTVRLVEGAQPQPVVLDTGLRFPLDAALFEHPKGVWIATGEGEPAREAVLRERGAEIVRVPVTHEGRIDLRALLRTMGARGIRSVMVEGGARVLASFLGQRLVSQVMITISPQLLDGAHLFGNGVGTLPGLTGVTHTFAGGDILLWGTAESDAVEAAAGESTRA